jgi:hypothetical protein
MLCGLFATAAVWASEAVWSKPPPMRRMCVIAVGDRCQSVRTSTLLTGVVSLFRTAA